MAQDRLILGAEDDSGKELIGNHPDTALVDRLVDVQGEPIGKRIVQQILCNPRISKIIFTGEPGGGKTTLMGQIAHKLIEDFSDRNLIKPLFYDDVLYETEREVRRKNPLKGDRDQWELVDWKYFNDKFVWHVKSPNNIPHGVRQVQFIEAPAVGHEIPKDRGRSAVRTLVRESVRRGANSDTILVHLNADPEAQNFASHIRSEIAATAPERVITMLRQNNIVLVGMPDNDKSGSKIKNETRRMAAAAFIEKIRTEMNDQASDWLDESVDSDSIMGSIALPERIKLKGAHMEHYLFDTDQLGLSKMVNGFNAFNKFNPEIIVYHYADLLSHV